MNDLRTRKATNAGTEPGLQPGSDKKHFSLTPAKFEGKPTNSYRRTAVIGDKGDAPAYRWNRQASNPTFGSHHQGTVLTTTSNVPTVQLGIQFK